MYELDRDWPHRPIDVELGEVAGVAVDHRDYVFVFNRGKHPVVVLDEKGAFVNAWGEGYFVRPHGIHIGGDGTVYCADEGKHTVSRHEPGGRLLLEIGRSGSPAPFQSGDPFNRCTHTAVSPTGEIYVSDGYGNSRIHKYSQDGELLHSFGSSGVGPGEFNLPHNLVCTPDGVLHVADRENHRIQRFDPDGGPLEPWLNVHRPSALHFVGGPEPRWIVGELGPVLGFNRGSPNLGPRLSVLDVDGVLLGRVGDEPAAGTGPRQFVSPHGISSDSWGSIFVGEVARTGWPNLFPDTPVPQTLTCLRKFRPVQQPD
jgi:hypothetical protein